MAVIVCPPTWIASNPETASTNAYQHEGTSEDRVQALTQYGSFVSQLREAGIEVLELNPPDGAPDAVFPNNWFSTHPDGTLAIYPMLAASRRRERDPVALRSLLAASGYRIDREIDFSYLEAEGEFLEGTGSLVIDHKNQNAYAVLSPRTTPRALAEVCTRLGLSRNEFRAMDQGMEVYHTNVVMAVCQDFAVICMEACLGAAYLPDLLTAAGKEVIEITAAQMRAFCGNVIELDRRVVLMSDQAYQAFLPEQLAILGRGRKIVHPDISAIERLGGGSARCMVAEVLLPCG